MLRTISISLCLVFVLFLGAEYTRAETLVAVTTTNTLISFDSATPGTVVPVGITGLQAGETILGIDRRPVNGQLYAIGSTSRLYTINSTTGAATQIGSAGAFLLSGTSFGIDFNPTVDRIRVVGNTGQNLRLNPNDGALTATDTTLAFAPGDPNFGITPRAVGAAYTNNVDGASQTTLFVIDSNLDIVMRQGGVNGTPSPNGGQLSTIGALGFNTSDLAGFDISGLTGTAYAALTSPGANLSQLFTINLSTGAATLIGTIGGGVAVNSLAAGVGNPVPEPATIVLLSVGLTGLGLKARKRRKAHLSSKG